MIIAPFSEYRSDGSAVNVTVDFDMPSDVTFRPHVFVGITFTNNSGVATTPGAGTFSLSAETLNNPGVFEAINAGTSVDATAARSTLDFAGNATRIRVTSTGITTATKFNIKVTANAS